MYYMIVHVMPLPVQIFVIVCVPRLLICWSSNFYGLYLIFYNLLLCVNI